MGNTLRNCVSSPEENEGSHTNLLRDNTDVSRQQSGQQRTASTSQAQSQRYYLTPNMSRRVDELSEDEQVKIAKRLGLIGYLPIRFFMEANKDGEKECAICMVEYENGDELRYLPCTHSFHKGCIDAWLMRSFTCPNCSQPVDSGLVGSFEPLGQPRPRDAEDQSRPPDAEDQSRPPDAEDQSRPPDAEDQSRPPDDEDQSRDDEDQSRPPDDEDQSRPPDDEDQSRPPQPPPLQADDRETPAQLHSN